MKSFRYDRWLWRESDWPRVSHFDGARRLTPLWHLGGSSAHRRNTWPRWRHSPFLARPTLLGLISREKIKSRLTFWINPYQALSTRRIKPLICHRWSTLMKAKKKSSLVQVEAFLAYWLSYFAFPSSLEDGPTAMSSHLPSCSLEETGCHWRPYNCAFSTHDWTSARGAYSSRRAIIMSPLKSTRHFCRCSFGRGLEHFSLFHWNLSPWSLGRSFWRDGERENFPS